MDARSRSSRTCASWRSLPLRRFEDRTGRSIQLLQFDSATGAISFHNGANYRWSGARSCWVLHGESKSNSLPAAAGRPLPSIEGRRSYISERKNMRTLKIAIALYVAAGAASPALPHGGGIFVKLKRAFAPVITRYDSLNRYYYSDYESDPFLMTRVRERTRATP